MATKWDDFTPVNSAAPTDKGGVDWSQFEPIKPDNTSNVGRGFKEAFQQVPQLGYGLLAGTGAAIETAFGEGGIGTGLKKAGVKGYTEWGDKIAAGSKESDSFDYSWDRAKEGDIGALGAWIAHGLGYAGGQAVQMLATAGLGAVAGKATLGTVAKSLAEGMVQKEAAALAATDAAKSLTAEQVTKLATQAVASKLGQTAAIGASAFGMEGGEIFGDLTQEATKEGKTLTGEQLAKAFGATLAAGGLEFVGDKIGLDVMLGKSKLLKPAEAVTGMKGRAARAGVAALGAAPIEGATEYGQTLLEEAGKGHDPFSDESLKQAKDAAALGALGGAAMGGVGGAVQSAKPKATAGDVLAAPTIDDAANKALLAISGPTKAAEWEVVDGTLALPGQAAQQQPEVLKALPGPDGQPVFMADDKGNVSVQPAAARVEALNRGFDAQQAADAAAADAMSLGKQAPVGLRPSEQPAPAVPVGETTEAPFIPTGEATEVERIPTGEASELLPTGEATEDPRKIATGKASEPDAGLVETIRADDILTTGGVPYGTELSANVRARKEGLSRDHVVEIPGAGWVIRPNLSVRSQPQQAPINAQPNNTRGTTAADVIQGPRDANRTDVGGNQGRGAADGSAGTGAGSVVQGQQPEARADGFASRTGSGADERAGAVPTGPGRGNDALTPGATFTMDGKAWTVQEVKDSAVSLRDAENNTRMVARNSKTFGKIMAALQPAATAPEPATAETHQAPQGDAPYEVTSIQQERVQTAAGALAPAAQATEKPQHFKSKDAASKAAKEAGNTLKVQKVKDGFILRAKTAKEVEAEAKAAQRLARGTSVNPDADTLLTAIAKLGGLDMRERADTVGTGNRNFGGKMLFRNGGQSIDTLANEALHELGYIPPEEHAKDGGVRWLRDAIAAEFMGTRTHHSQRGDSWMKAAEDEARQRAEDFAAGQAEREAAPDYDPFTDPYNQVSGDPLAYFTVDDLDAAGYTGVSPEVQAVTERLLAEAEAAGLDTEAIIERVAQATDGATEHDYHTALQAEITRLLARDSGGVQGADASRAEASPAGDGQAAEEAGRGQEGEGLTPEDRRRFSAEYQSRATEVQQELSKRGDLQKLFKFYAGVRSIDSFSALPIEEQADAYVNYVEAGGSPVQFAEAYNDKVVRMEREALIRRLQSEDQVRQANGKPFKTGASASAFQREHDLIVTHEVRQEAGGFILKRRPPAAQAEILRKQAGLPSYAEAQATVIREMGIGETADGELDATEAQFDEMERRISALMRGKDAPLLTTQTTEDLKAKADREDAAQRAEKAKRDAEQPAPAEAATTILDAAGVTGKERLDALKDVKAGTVTPEELAAAYPAKQEAPAITREQESALYDYLRQQTDGDAVRYELLAKKFQRAADGIGTDAELAITRDWLDAMAKDGTEKQRAAAEGEAKAQADAQEAERAAAEKSAESLADLKAGKAGNERYRLYLSTMTQAERDAKTSAADFNVGFMSFINARSGEFKQKQGGNSANILDQNGFTDYIRQWVADHQPAQNEAPAELASPLDAAKAVMREVYDGKASVETYQAGYRRVRDDEAGTRAALNKLTKDQLIRQFGIIRDGNKAELVDIAYGSLLRGFALGKEYGPNSYIMSSGGLAAHEAKKREALDALVAGQTAEDLAAYAAEVAKEREAYAARREEARKAVENPKTLDDFRRFMSYHTRDGKTTTEVRRTMLTPEQRAEFDRLLSAESRSGRKATAEVQKTRVAVAGQKVDGDIIATKHTRKGHDIFVVRLAERVSREDYDTLNAGAKRIGGYYSSFKGAGAVPGFQFTTREQAEAFRALANGDNTAAVEAAKERRDAFEDDRSQTAVERLNEMADRLQDRADESMGRERKANTARRARFAASAEAAASADKALATTMRNIATAIGNGTASMLDRVRQKVQVEYLRDVVQRANDDMIRERSGSYAEYERNRGAAPTQETADFATFPEYTAMRSDLASMGRQLLETEGTKALGQRLMKVADDVSDAFTAWVKEPGLNFTKVAVFTKGGGAERAVFPSKDVAERAIERSGFRGKAIPWSLKRGEWHIIMSPSEAMNKGIWQGDGDKRITLSDDFGAELVEKIGRANRRGARVSVPWAFEATYDRRKVLGRMGIETPAEFRTALREFIALQERPEAPSRVKELERALIGRRNDGFDFFPTPEGTADEMVAAADIQPGMRVLEPSGGMGHIADRIRAAGHEPEVIEIEGDKRELLEAKGFNVVGRDFLAFNDANHAERGYTFGDVFRAPDGTLGVMRGSNGMGGSRVGLDPLDENGKPDPRRSRWESFDELEGVEKRGVGSGYDRILMNPPFSNGRDIEHVRHAYGLLKPGGRLVAIMGESAFNNQNKRAAEFRDWLDELGGTSEKLAEGTFLDPSLPVNTGANARMVVIEKPEGATNGEAPKFSRATDTIPLDQSDAIGREFWRKIKEGETFTEQEVLNALSINRRGSRRDARSLEVTPGGPTTGESIVHWSGEIAGFDGYRTSAAWVADSFTVFVIPEELAAGADLSDSTQARDRAIVAYAFTPLRGGLYELAINDVAPDSTAENALRERGKLQDAGIESNPYRRVDIGHTLSRALLQESIRRLAINIGQTPSVYYAQRDTGARAGQDESGRGFDAERVERNFSRSGRTGRGISITDAEAIAADIRATMPTAPQIVVVESVSQLPDKLRALIEQAGADNDVEGVYWGGKVYAVTAHFSDLDRFRFVVAHHELRHHGFGAMLGPRLHRMMMQIYRSNAKVRALADQNIRDGIAKDVVVATEEALADMPVEDLVKLRGWQRIVAAVREFLRNLSMKLEKRHPKLADMLRPEGWTDEDIARLISRAEDMSRTGEPDYVRGGAVFSQDRAWIINEVKDAIQEWDGPALRKIADPMERARALRELRGLLNGGTTDADEMHRIAYNWKARANKLAPASGKFGAGPAAAAVSMAEKMAESGKQHSPVALPFGKEFAVVVDGRVVNTTSTMKEAQESAEYTDAEFWRGEITGAPDAWPQWSRNGAPLFSRARPNVTPTNAQQAMAEALQSFGDTKLPGDYIISDFIQSHGKLSWWDKTVGSMHNLAQRNPLFKPVYDRAQDFLNAVSTFATEAADLAPTLLPKLEGLRDLGKSPLSAEDTKAISAPIFEGTLLWTRDDNGRIVREEDPQKAGVVWRDDELRSRYNLNDSQIKLYREFRAATNKSLTDMTIADMIRFGGADVMAVQERAMRSGDVKAAAEMMADHLTRMADDDSDRAGVLIDTASRIMDKADQAVNLMRRGYAPLTRFGHYTLDVIDAEGERVYFGLFESQAEANRFARKMRAAYPDASIQQGTLSQEAYKMFAGISPETAELFGQMLGLEAQGDDAASQAFQEYLKLAKSNRSAMKRLIERKGIAGFSEDAGRVLAGFIYSNARQAAKNLHMGAMNEAVQAIAKAKGKGELLDTAVRLHQYIANPQEEAQKIKGLMFTQFLGGSLAAGLVNLSQVPMVTFPYLSQFGGAAKAAVNLKRGLADALKWETAKTDAQRTTGDAALDRALKRAEEDGIVSPQEIHSLIAQANGSGALKAGDGTKAGNLAAKGSNFLSKLGLVWGKPFAIAEQFNRRATFIAAYRTAVEQSMPNPAQFAEQAVTETQFSYTKANRPEWARGALGSVLFTFKTYSISYVELLYRMAKSGPEGKKAALLALGVMFLMAGMQGLPGADDLDDIIDGIMQRLGYNFSSKQAKREFFAKLMGEGGAQFMMRGVSGLPGAPIDVANRLGLGNLIPGTGLLTKKIDHTSDVTEIGGPALSFGKQLLTGADQLTQGNFGKAVESVLPVAAANAVKAIDMASSGMYRDQLGRKVIDTDAYDAVAKAIGFQPNDVSKVQTATREVQQMVGLNKMREAEIADQWAQAIFDNDAAGKDAARQALDAWNRDNPESPIKITTAQLLKRLKAMREDKMTRIEHTAPKEIRATVHRELAEAR